MSSIILNQTQNSILNYHQPRKYELCYYFLISILTDQLKDICKEYFERMYLCEGQKWDLEHEVRKRDWEVLPKIKQNQIYQKAKYLQNNLDLFDEMKKQNTNKTFCHPFLIFDNFI